MCTRIIAVLILLLAASSAGSAQPALSIMAGRGVDALHPRGEATGTAQSSALDVDAEHVFANERVRIYYEGSVSRYAVPGDWQTALHEAGWRYRIGPSTRRLFIGSSLGVRRNGASWDAANYSSLGVLANLEWHPRETSAIRLGYRADRRRFPSTPALDQWQHTGFGSLLVNMPSRTTLVGELTAGAKRYNDGLPASAGARLGQAYVRVAQSIASRASVIADVAVRRTFGDIPAAIIATPARFFDDGVYDDPFASGMRSGGLALKAIVARDVRLSAGVSRQYKPYAATPALDPMGTAIGALLRTDTVTRAAATSTWPLAPSRTGAFTVQLVAGYDYTRHRSTTSRYNYGDHAVSLGLSVVY